jgi:hypothetical protein
VADPANVHISRAFLQHHLKFVFTLNKPLLKRAAAIMGASLIILAINTPFRRKA